MKENVVVIGGGISGLLSAYILSENPNYQVHVIEKSSKCGGLLKCFDYGSYGKFDYGAHNIIETGLDELDSILWDLLPEKEWHVSSAINNQRRALTGLFFNDKLQKNSPFVDLRFHKNINKMRMDFLVNYEKKKSLNKKNAYTLSKSLFGKEIAKTVIVPIFKSLYGIHPSKMDYMAMYLTPLTRVGLFDKNISDELLSTINLSSLLSYPEQRELGVDVVGTKKVFYPKKYGMYRVVDSLIKKLEARGVIITLNNQVRDLEIENSTIKKVTLNNDICINNINKFIWTAGILPLSKLLDINTKNLAFNKAPNTVITNILTSKKLKLKDLSYVYNYDSKYKTFRIDNYINYCSGAKRKDLYPISIEMLLTDEEIKDKSKISKLALYELKKLGILKKNTEIPFIKTEVLENGFPLLSVENIKSMDLIRKKINKKEITNLVSIGVLAEKDLFFEGEIQKDLFNKLKG